MEKNIVTINLTEKKGFYTLEAAILLPMVILAVLSIGYFICVDSSWENCMYEVIDESTDTAMRAGDGLSEFTGKNRILKRVKEENSNLREFRIRWYLVSCRDRYSGGVTSYSFQASPVITVPFSFSKKFQFEGRIKYRGFKGLKKSGTGMGADELETDEERDPVWIFPQSGERYHSEDCSYVKASVSSCILTDSLKRERASCDLCHSGELETGSLVFCFKNRDTAYHRGNCRSIKKHTAVINRSEAEKKGYTPCSKCGGKGDYYVGK